jgi:hypothetical protein
MLLHFFNRACPCSRFNVDHVRELHARYRGQVLFVAVLREGDPDGMAKAFRSLKLF